jgi:FkbM family methyltransferase
MSTSRIPSPIRRYARQSVRLLRRTYRTMSSIPRYRDVDLQCGVTVNIDMRHRNWYQVYKKGYHEQDVEKFISGFLQSGDTVLDVGAQIGMFTAIAAQLIGPEGQLYAFEPDEKNHRDLQGTRERNHLDNVTIINAGLSDSVGEATFHRPDGAWGSFMDGGMGDGASITRDFFKNTTIKTFTIQTQTIDHVVREKGLKRLDLIKIDVDGPEVTILRGASETLATLKPAVMVEASRFYEEHGASVGELFSILLSHGYQIYGTIRNGETAIPMSSADDIPVDLSAVGSAMNFFCMVPGTYDERWQELWFMQES